VDPVAFGDLENYNADYYAIDFQTAGLAESPWYDIAAAAAGTVLVARNRGDGYGNKVVLDHGADSLGNRYTTTYAHLASISSLAATVEQGKHLGIAGNTGGDYPVHLHFHMMLGLNAIEAEPMSGWGGTEPRAAPPSTATATATRAMQ
jgi:murein DD-endopeptidase MepM/ murein hydrolase activator NlpD